MKKLLLLILCICCISPIYAQKNNLSSLWKQVDSLADHQFWKELPPILSKIETEAIKRSWYDEQIKAFLYQEKVKLQTSDNTDIKVQVIQEFDDKIKQVNNKAAKAILTIQQARNYSNYLTNNYYVINQRTEIQGGTKQDFTFWTKNQFYQNIESLYKSVLIEKNTLLNESKEKWIKLIEVEKHQYLPTLYDIAVYDYIDLLEGNQQYQMSLANNQKDIRIKLVDSLYQNLIDIHQGKNNDAYLFNVYQLFQKKQSQDSLKAKELETWIAKYNHSSLKEIMIVDLINIYRNNASTASPTRQNKLDEFIQKIDAYLPRADSLNTKNYLTAIRANIFKPYVQLEVKEFNIPNKEALLKVKHQNANKIYYKIVQPKNIFNRLESELITYYDSTIFDRINTFIKNNVVLKEGVFEVRYFKDNVVHETTILLPQLPAGSYTLIYSSTPFDQGYDQKAIYGHLRLNYSQYAILNKDNKVLILDRETGEKQTGAAVKFYAIQQDKYVEQSSSRTNELGVFLNDDKNRNSFLTVNDENIIVPFNNYYYYRNQNVENNETTYDAKVFTDRSIYRPGQIVYFKAIVYKNYETIKYTVVPDKKIVVELVDANNQKVDAKTLTTNEFGSASGSFILNNGGLTGNYSIQIKEGNINQTYSFQVEEYKRPKFEVTFDEFKDKKSLGDSIFITGKAVSFNGVPLPHAQVAYTVDMIESRFRINDGFYSDSYDRIIARPRTEKIKADTILTDQDGNFKINFKSELPKDLDKKLKLTQNFRVEVSVMDVTGETNESATSLTIGNIPFNLVLTVPSQTNANNLDSIGIRALNLSGQEVLAKGKIILKKKKERTRLILPPLFSIENNYSYYNSIPQKEFLQKFPYESYGNEYTQKDEYTNLDEIEFDLAKSKKIKLPNSTDMVGMYNIEAISIVERDTIREEQNFEVFHNKLQSDQKSTLKITTDKDRYEIGDIAKISLQTDFDALQLNITSSENEKIDFKTISSNKTSIQIEIPKTTKNSLVLNFAGMKNGQLFTHTKSLDIIQKIPSLILETRTFRNKLYPGQKEQWELLIKGNNGEKLAAEVLVNMYDASLDKLKDVSPHNFSFVPNRFNYPSYSTWSYYNQNVESQFFRNDQWIDFNSQLTYDRFKTFGFNINNYDQDSRIGIRGISGISKGDANNMTSQLQRKVAGVSSSAPMTSDAGAMYDQVSEVVVVPEPEKTTTIQIRKNLQETAFFLPQLRTDKDGNVIFSFDSPESLTRWKFMALAHSKDLAIGTYTAFVETQKDLMIIPNMPRFFRETDQITLQSKVNNLSENELNAGVTLELFDALTLKSLDIIASEQQLTLSAKNSKSVEWDIKIPKNIEAITYRIAAKAGKFSDAEESTIPVLKNSMLVTETLPISVREGQVKTFEMPNLNNSSATTEPYQYTLELTSNPIYHALFALPYVNEYPYESSESIFSKFYLNSLSTHLVNQNPKIKTVFDSWKNNKQLNSKLSINDDLKSILIQETPWLQDALREEETMKNIANLFNQNSIKSNLEIDLNKLASYQSANGGFAWYPGGNQSFNISSYILTGITKLTARHVIQEFDLMDKINPILTKGLQYLDNEILYSWNRYQENNKLKPSIEQGIQYLLIRSAYPAQAKNNKLQPVIDYYLKEIDKDKLNYDLAKQAQVAIILNRYQKKSEAQLVIKQLQQKSVESEEKGMYWNQNQAGWTWFQAPIETQAMLIQAFEEVNQDKKAIENMKIWLIKNKQVRHWNSTKATVAAVDALLNYGEHWIDGQDDLRIKVAGNSLDLHGINKQAGSGYLKEVWFKTEIKPTLGTVEIAKNSPGVALGGLYYQYFEDLDKIQSSSSTIALQKELYIKKIEQLKEVLIPITATTPIQLGDIVKVRISIKTDRNLAFIHLKDMRAAGFEPTNVTSTYKYKQGLGYYESTKDAATNFFMDYLPQGSHVFEYELRANNAGKFSNGITTIQNLYAPEMSAHSVGIGVKINNK
ncbi:MG2 domain-containing protein [Sphingobacterium sp. SRCM116780]|uniref:alpha-2-macroglobulin family protein n=1 Tax=Sphingobacterium sp. SRCM116780 TaxID=2907623 RepID=UPI001F2F27A4|nr:alpha-2-macroglobulin family protein [Sphingobacterium sp. SRCM116780]UIR54539.1 MG2 domain-containing protein [Sphingobacterium sp. SRCM116780]